MIVWVIKKGTYYYTGSYYMRGDDMVKEFGVFNHAQLFRKQKEAKLILQPNEKIIKVNIHPIGL